MSSMGALSGSVNASNRVNSWGPGHRREPFGQHRAQSVVMQPIVDREPHISGRGIDPEVGGDRDYARHAVDRPSASMVEAWSGV